MTGETEPRPAAARGFTPSAPGDRTHDVLRPSPLGLAARGLTRSAFRTATLLGRRQLRQPRGRVGDVVRFSDGSDGRVYRETVIADREVDDPATLIVGFRLRLVRGRAHAWFRAESVLNTPLFAGFPGFVSKLWLAHDANDLYRGIYEWDGAEQADDYVRSLWWALAVASEPTSIRSVVIPGVRRDHVLEQPEILADVAPTAAREWWRPAGTRGHMAPP